MASNKHFDLRKIENSGTAIFKEHLFFLNKKSNVFEIKNSKVLGQIKPRFSFCLEINFRKMERNKHVNLRKIENFVRSEYYPEEISKDKRKRANFRKSVRA